MSKAFWRSPQFVLICASSIILVAYGSRQSFGMFLRPVTEALGWGQDVRVMSLSTGIQALIYGIAAPFVGAIADRWGPIKVLIISALVYAFGLYSMSQSVSAQGLVISIGFLTGLGSSGVALPMLLSIVGRVAPEKQRILWLSIVVSGGHGRSDAGRAAQPQHDLDVGMGRGGNRADGHGPCDRAVGARHFACSKRYAKQERPAEFASGHR